MPSQFAQSFLFAFVCVRECLVTGMVVSCECLQTITVYAYVYRKYTSLCVCMLWHLCFHYLTFFAVYFTISHIFLTQAQMEKAHRAQPIYTASRFSSHYHLSISNSFDFIHFFRVTAAVAAAVVAM